MNIGTRAEPSGDESKVSLSYVFSSSYLLICCIHSVEWDLGVSDALYGRNSIEGYLLTEPVPNPLVKASRGPLKYWQTQTDPAVRPRLAKFAISYLSTPDECFNCASAHAY